MFYEGITELIKKHLFVIFREKFYTNDEVEFVDRFVAKHPLLRPELIVVNDQLHGFKKISKHVASLEKFPIYLEIEGLKDGEEIFIDHIDLYAEASVNCQNRLSDIMAVTKQFENYITLDRVIRLNNITEESLIVFSKIQNLYMEEFSDVLCSQQDKQILLKESRDYLKKFIFFIRILDDMVIKNKSLKSLEKEISEVLKVKG